MKEVTVDQATVAMLSIDSKSLQAADQCIVPVYCRLIISNSNRKTHTLQSGRSSSPTHRPLITVRINRGGGGVRVLSTDMFEILILMVQICGWTLRCISRLTRDRHSRERSRSYGGDRGGVWTVSIWYLLPLHFPSQWSLTTNTVSLAPSCLWFSKRQYKFCPRLHAQRAIRVLC